MYQENRGWLSRHAVTLALIASCLGFVLLAATAVYVTIRNTQINRSLCQTSIQARTALRNVIRTQERQAIANANTLEQTLRIINDYDALLAVVPPITCSSSGEPQEPSLPEQS